MEKRVPGGTISVATRKHSNFFVVLYSRTRHPSAKARSGPLGKAADLPLSLAKLSGPPLHLCLSPSILPMSPRPASSNYFHSSSSSPQQSSTLTSKRSIMATATQTMVKDAIEGIENNPKVPAVEIGPSSAGRALSSSSSSSPSSSNSPPAPIHETSTTTEAERPKLSTLQAWIVIIQLCGNNFINSFSAGLLMVCLPVMAADLNLPQNLLTWPNSVSALTSGSCYLIMGYVSDVLGARRVNIPGSFLQSVFIIATGACQNGAELIAFRALGGVANALFTPSARAMLSKNLAHGRLRNFGFATLVLAFPLGAGLGLVLGGIYADKANWRVGYYSSGAIGLCLSLLGFFTLPKDEKPLGTSRETLRRLAFEIDWLGVALASGSVTMLSYVFAMLSVSADEIHRPTNIALLVISIALLPAFGLWMHRQEKLQRPAVIPNSLWKDSRFTSICLMIGLSNGAQSGLGLFTSLLYVYLPERCYGSYPLTTFQLSGSTAFVSLSSLDSYSASSCHGGTVLHLRRRLYQPSFCLSRCHRGDGPLLAISLVDGHYTTILALLVQRILGPGRRPIEHRCDVHRRLLGHRRSLLWQISSSWRGGVQHLLSDWC